MKPKRLISISAIMILLIVNLVYSVEIEIKPTPLKTTKPDIHITYSQPVKFDEGYPQVSSSTGNLVKGTDFNVVAREGKEFNNEYDLTFTQPLAEGVYYIYLSGKSSAGYPTGIDTAKFTIPGIEIVLESPGYGFSDKIPFDIIIKTKYPNGPANVNCKYSWGVDKPYNNMLNNFYEPPPSSTHTIKGITETLTRDLYVACLDGTKEKHARFVIGYDPTSPIILNYTATPSEVKDTSRPFTKINVTTDDKTVCTYKESNDENISFFPNENYSNYSSFKTDHEVVIPYPPEKYGISRHELLYTIKCSNMAGSSDSKQLGVVVHYGSQFTITLISPETYTNDEEITFSISPSVISICKFSNGSSFDTVKNNIHSKNLGELEEGNYSYKVSCASDITTTTQQFNFTVDRTPPSNVTLEIKSVCGGRINISAVATDNIGIKRFNYVVQIGNSILQKNSSSSGSFYIDVSQVSDSNIKLKIQAEDLAGNLGELLTKEIFIPGEDSPLCPEERFIKYKSPPLGFATTPSFNIVIETKRVALCRWGYGSKDTPYSSLNLFEEDKSNITGTKHTILNYNSFGPDNTTTLLIKCKEPDDKMHAAHMLFGYDSTPPVLSVSANPNPVNDVLNKFTELTVTSNDYVYCKYNNINFNATFGDNVETAYSKIQKTTIDYSNINDFLPYQFNYSVVCKNLAQLSTTKPYSVLVNFLRAINLTIISPPRYTKEKDIDLIILPKVSVIEPCLYKKINDTQYSQFTFGQNNTQKASLGSFEDGDYQYIIQCTSPTAIQDYPVEFTVDTVPPQVNFSIQPEACIGQNIKLLLDITELHLGEIYAILTDENGTEKNQTVNKTLPSLSLSGFSEGDYEVKILVTDLANNSAEELASIKIYPADYSGCKDFENPPYCYNGVQDGNETGLDCGGDCKPCDGDAVCETDEDCVSGVCDNNICRAECLVDEDCDMNEVCKNGVCESTIQNPPTFGGINCTTEQGLEGEPVDSNEDGDFDDEEDDYDGDGVNNSLDNEPCGELSPEECEEPPCDEDTEFPEEEREKKTPILALIFIILGLLLSGGSGYFLYYQHSKKPSSPAFVSSTISPIEPSYPPSTTQISSEKEVEKPTPSPTIPPLSTTSISSTEVPSEKSLISEKIGEKLKEKRKVLQIFETKEEDKEKQVKRLEKKPLIERIKKTEKVTEKGEEETGREEEFISLEDIGKSKEQKEKKPIEEGKIKKKSVFEELEEMTKGKK